MDGPARRSVRRTALEGGDRLLSRGDPARRIHLLRSGLLAASGGPAGETRLLGLVHPGEAVGEMAVLAGTPHANDVTAFRDSVVDSLDADDFLQAAARRPEVMAELARLVVRRARGAGPGAAHRPARTVLIAAVSPGLHPRPLANALAGRCCEAGLRAPVLGRDDAQGDGWLARAERDGDLVLLVASEGEDQWAAACRRQVDRVLLLGRGGDPPPPDCGLCESEPIQAHQLVDLVLEHPLGRTPRGSARWLDATRARRLLHVGADGRGVARLARILTGRSVGLALSGGGARAFAHVGVVRALR